MSARVANITVDCHDVLAVARFWSAVLGRPLDEGSTEDWAAIGGTDLERARPAWFFERVPERKVAKNRLHVDLVDPDPGVMDRLVQLGATVVDEHELGAGGHRWWVLQDPEGNEFCVAHRVFGA